MEECITTWIQSPLTLFPINGMRLKVSLAMNINPLNLSVALFLVIQAIPFANGHFWQNPKHPLFKEALDTSMENLRKKNFKLTHEKEVLKATGPICFTEIGIKYIHAPEILFLDMDVFAPIYLQKPDLSNCIVFHQFHGSSGWKLEFQCPQIRLK